MTLSKRIVQTLAETQQIPEDEIEVYEYCVNGILEMGLNIIATLLLGLVLHRFVMTLLFLLLVIPLKSFIGGWHARTSSSCFVLSIGYYLICIMVPGVLTFLPVGMIPAVFAALWIGIWLIAPVECRTNPWDETEYSRMRRYTRITLGAAFVLAIVFMLLHRHIYVLEWSFVFLFSLISLLTEKKYHSSHSC